MAKAPPPFPSATMMMREREREREREARAIRRESPANEAPPGSRQTLLRTPPGVGPDTGSVRFTDWVAAEPRSVLLIN